ncbi:MAG: DUF4340 domain-containing protein [Phycisphaerae bacterium]
MNFRTTFFLAVVLAGLGIAYLWRPQPSTVETARSTERAPLGTPGISRDVLVQKPGDVEQVVCRNRAGEEWTFQKQDDSGDAGRSKWRMTSPSDMPVVSWEVERFGRELSDLKYEISYKPGEPGAVTAPEAGLDPPERVVTLTDDKGESVSIEIGKEASTNSTYVKLADNDEIYVATRSLRHLFKRHAREYRDKLLWSFKPQDARRVELVDRSNPSAPVTYAFARDTGRWMMESPVTARATSKIDDMVSTMSRLRAVEWRDDKPERLAAYGLKPASLTIRLTVEEEIPVDEDAEEAASEDAESPAKEESQEQEQEEGQTDEEQKPKTKKTLTVYELHLSDKSPIGEDTKTFMCIGSETMVATVMKSIADKLRPVMSQWREMRITTANVANATRVKLSNSLGAVDLVKRDGRWWYTDDSGPAEDKVVKELLDAVRGLSAVAFVDGEVTDEGKYGLDDPRADVELTIPGVEGTERIKVGGYTDAKSKLLVYVRRNQLASVAKVRVGDVAKLLNGPRTYRDRTVLNIPAASLQQVAISTENRLAQGRMEVELKRGDDGWHMSAPVTASVRGDRVDKLIESLSSLRAESIVDETGDVSPYGLHAPAAVITLTYRPPVEYRFEPAEAHESTGEKEDGSAEAESSAQSQSPAEDATTEHGDKVVPVEVQPPAESLQLLVTAHDGRFYAKRDDRQTVYEVNKTFFDQLLKEYRAGEIMTFDASSAREFSITQGDVAHTFIRDADKWIYKAEPDLPLDPKKVDNLLLQLRDLQTERYVTHNGADLSAFGLADAYNSVTVTLDDGTAHTLRVARDVCQRDPKKGHYATVDDSDAVFLITRDDAERLRVSLVDLEAAP